MIFNAFRPRCLHAFRPESPLRNAAGIFILTTLFYFIGAELRLVEALSLFWPLNGVMAGVFARYTYLNRLHNYAVSYVAMLMYDAVTTNWEWPRWSSTCRIWSLSSLSHYWWCVISG